MDFGAIGEAWAFGSVMKRANQETQDWIDWSQREVSMAKARGNAQDAGRRAQIRLLVDALKVVDPGHPALQPTGLLHPDGSVELRYHRVFDQSYDEVATKGGIPLCSKAVHPREAARLKVMREPVETKRVLLCKTFWFRGEQYRSERGAVEARKRAADKAAEAVAYA